MTYEGNIELDKIFDPIEKKAVEIQVNEFGQTPRQLFKTPHPKKYSNKVNDTVSDDLNIQNPRSNLINNNSNSKFNIDDINFSKKKGKLILNYTEIKNEIEEKIDKTKFFPKDPVKFIFDRNLFPINKFHKK